VYGRDGKIRVIVSDDGKTWQSAALLADDGIDLRDPKFSITPDGRLMLLCGGSMYEGRNFRGRRPRVAFSRDGATWSKLAPILDDGDWLWRATWHDGHAYGVSYKLTPRSDDGDENEVSLYRSEDGLQWDRVVRFDIAGRPNETTLRVLPDGEMLAWVRRESADQGGWIGTSRPPYEKWKWSPTKYRLGGPNFVRLPHGQLIAATRSYAGGPQTVLGLLTPVEFTPQLTLPSGGDTSYAGLLWHDGLLWVSYYASHEGKTSIYLAQVRVGNE
jgi:hypothetical protein